MSFKSFITTQQLFKKNNLLQIQSSESESGTVITNAQSHDNYKKNSVILPNYAAGKRH